MDHGGDIYTNTGITKDFSVNLSPIGPPEEVRTVLAAALWETLSCYPDPLCRDLRHALSERLQVSESQIICGNGASELIQAVLLAVRPEKVLIPVPTYQGYKRAVLACGAEPVFFCLDEEKGFAVTDDILKEIKMLPKGGALFICNPNNPVGNLVRPDLMEKIADTCRKAEVYLIVDECYLALLSEEKTLSMRRFLMQNPFLIILRAFTKTFSMPGLRLGYLLTGNEGLLAKVCLQLPEWSVSMFAQKAGIVALQKSGGEDSLYLARARQIILEERLYVSRRLKNLGARVYEGKSGFLLFSCAPDLYEPLKEEGILIRRCNDFRGIREIAGKRRFYRIGLQEHDDNVYLLDCIEEIGKRGK